VQAAREKNITILCNADSCSINADYDRLKQVFFNVLSNAVKYTDKGSITIRGVLPPSPEQTRAMQASLNDTRYTITVADTGIGIPNQDLSRIFDRFYRTDKSRARNTGGEGLGLAIAAAIVKAHNGVITACSPPEGGSIFCVKL
jgi:signal transduction histidine kinase